MAISRSLRVPHPWRQSYRRNGWGIERSSTAFAVIATTLAAAILYRFPPEHYSFYPLCPIHEYLHLLCPGCGATRALSALLHGHLTMALHDNAFAVLVLLPLAAIYIIICLNRSRKDGPFRWPMMPTFIGIALTLLATAFTVFRNL